jgi:hypothetical protein
MKMRIHFKNKESKILFYKHLKLILFLLVALFFWSNLHEVIHMFALKEIGHNYVYKWNLFRPLVTCLDCQQVTKFQVFYYSFAPYILNIIAMIFGIIAYRNIWSRYLLHFGYLDILGNYIALGFYFFNNDIQHDFINIALVGFWYVPILLFLFSTVMWFRVNWGWLKKEIIEIKKLRKNAFKH